MSAVADLTDALLARLPSVSLCAARLLPVAFLCPVLGGQAVPTTVKLGLVLSLSLSLHVAGGVVAPAAVTGWELGALVLKEMVLGVTIGLLAAVPFDAARVAGRFIDLFRGTSAEAALPQAGSRESATGDLLYQLLVALAVTGAVLPMVLEGLWRSYALIPLGMAPASELDALHVVSVVSAAMGTALAVSAPVLGVVLAADCLVALGARAAPQMGLQELATPLKIMGGGAVLWIGVGLIAQRLLELAVAGVLLPPGWEAR